MLADTILLGPLLPVFLELSEMIELGIVKLFIFLVGFLEVFVGVSYLCSGSFEVICCLLLVDFSGVSGLFLSFCFLCSH